MISTRSKRNGLGGWPSSAMPIRKLLTHGHVEEIEAEFKEYSISLAL